MIVKTPVMRPTLEAWGWQWQGACRTADPELSFHGDMERGVARRHREAAALLVCVSCPVLIRCRRYALEQREADGVWGGSTEEQRQAWWQADEQRSSISRRRGGS